MQGAIRGGALTQKLLAFGREQPLAAERIDANRLVESMADLIRRAVGERVLVELDLGSGLWPIDVDSNQLESALLNLAVNARDAMPDGGQLLIKSRNIVDPQAGKAETLGGPHVVLTVTDTGCGMSADVATHAFDPLFTTKPVGEGSGLGLSQVYSFVSQSKGHVDIVSLPGNGTSIRIYLPRAVVKADRAAAVVNVAPLTTAPLGRAG
jgi:signal transduction histidine kinase